MRSVRHGEVANTLTGHMGSTGYRNILLGHPLGFCNEE